jgi:hypothetical protein
VGREFAFAHLKETTMAARFLSLTLAVALSAGLWAAPASNAEAASRAKSGDEAQAAKKKKGKARKQVKPQATGPELSEALTPRERRLKRECQGQVNAGACAGYTR